MTRPLEVVDARDVDAVFARLRAALSGDGPAILPHDGHPEELPAEVPQRVAVVIETSGSTGRPKRVMLGADALLASAAASESQLGGGGQWLLALPTNYIAGINVLVRSLASQTDPMIAGDDFVEAAHRLSAPRRYTSLVPAQLARLIETDAAHDTLRRFDRILVGGQAMPQALAARALELGLNLTRTYGSSETSGGCVWDGEPIGDTEVRIVDGRVELAGSSLAYGYLDDPERTDRAFVEHDGKRWYRTDDTGRLENGGLTVTGRIDDVLVSGGVKVSLAEVEAVVRDIPGLIDAVVVSAPHDRWGEAPVVVTTASVDLAMVRETVAARLGAAARPDRVVVVDAMPLGATGKPDRLGIAALVRR